MTNMLQSSMKIFNRKPEPTSEHVALLFIKNDHLQIQDTIDLTALSYESLNTLIDVAEDLHDLQMANDPEDVKNLAEYSEDEDD